VLVTVAVSMFIVLAAARVIDMVYVYERLAPTASAELEKRLAIENSISKLISSAWISSDTTRVDTYLVASSSTGVTDSSDTLTFTTIGVSIPQSVIESKEASEDSNKDFGPYGGVSEVSLSTVPVGTPTDTKGLFVRRQTPADGDPTQGGYESRLSADVESISFEFFDGTEWVQVWDTRNGQAPLPTGICVTYKLADETNSRTFYVRLVHATTSSTTSTSTGGTTP